jgi:hypothetical protein
MAVSYTFRGSILRMDFVGCYAPQAIIDAFDEAMADPRFFDNACLLIDVTRSESLVERSVDDLRLIVDNLGPRTARVGRRFALLAGAAVHFGLLRMVVVFAEAHDVEARAFTDEDEAVVWLSQSQAGTKD